MLPHITYARPGARPWRCRRCQAYNLVIPYRVFKLPEFECRCCQYDYFKDNDLDLCLGDVKVNGISLIPNIMVQIGPNCFEYACTQAIRMNYLVDVAFKNKIPSPSVLSMDPLEMVDKYYWKYWNNLDFLQLPSFHKTLKVLDSFWSEGIPLDDGSVHQVGDIAFMDRTDFKGICQMIANGEPVVACLQPGVGLNWLEYGEFYRSPVIDGEIQICSEMHKRDPHVTHAVVLVGVRTNHRTGAKGYWVVNSWPPYWCRRNVISGDVEGTVVRFGIGLIREEDLLSNAIKFGLPGDSSANDDPMGFRSEAENGTINLHNYWLFNGCLYNPNP